MNLKAVDLVREIRDNSFKLTCRMSFEERLEFIRNMVDKTDQRMEDAGYLVTDKD